MTADPRLAHLLELAGKGPALRAALAEEAAALLIAWPYDCPAEMRVIFENLLARTAREVDADTRARLRVQLYADRALAARVLPREDSGTPLIAAARGEGDIVTCLTEHLGLARARIGEVLRDESGEALAAACKGVDLSRAVYSTLALLVLPEGEDLAGRLDAYDRVSASDAARTLRAWRGVKAAAAAE